MVSLVVQFNNHLFSKFDANHPGNRPDPWKVNSLILPLMQENLKVHFLDAVSIEALATLRQLCQITYRNAAEEVVEVRTQIVDVYAANKADWLKLKDGTEIRLDRLLSVDGKPTRFAQE